MVSNKIPEEVWPIIAEAYQNGLTLSEIGRRFDCSRNVIKKIIVSQGIELRKCLHGNVAVNPTPEEIADRIAEVQRNRLRNMDAVADTYDDYNDYSMFLI
jgi:transposase-like protein